MGKVRLIMKISPYNLIRKGLLLNKKFLSNTTDDYIIA